MHFNPSANGASQEFPWITTFIPNPSSGGGGPSVTSISPNPAAVGTSVTITGTNFGASQGSSTVKFNGTNAGTAPTWSATAISLLVPNGATTGGVVVTVGGVASSPYTFTVQATPNISGITPNPALVGTTITGTNFGATQGTSTVKFNGTNAGAGTWNPTSIVIPVPTGAATGSVVVTVGGVASNPYNFTVSSVQTFAYDAAASGNNGGVYGASSTISVSVPAGELVEANCETFGGSSNNTVSDSLSNTWQLAASITTTNLAQVDEWYSVIAHAGSDTIQCQGSSGTSFVELGTVGEVSSTGWPASPLDQANAVYFSTASSCNVSTPAATSQPVELAIAGCATAGGVVGSASGWTLRQQWSSNSGAFFDSPLSSTGIVHFNPSANGASQEFPWITTFIPNPSSGGGGPSVTSISPTALTPGGQLTINGSGFGASQGAGYIAFQGAEYVTAVSSWSATQIIVTVPSNVIPGNLYVNQNGTSSNLTAYTVVASVITSISPTALTPGGLLTINGSGFGASQGSGYIAFQGAGYVTAVTSWSATQIVVTVPSNVTPGNLYVNQNGTASNLMPYTVPPTPNITSITPNPAALGTSVTITGSNFGASQVSGSTVSFNGTNAGTASSWSATSITLAVPSGATTGGVVVTVGGVASSSWSLTVQATPTISSISPTALTPGGQLTINGSGFGASQGAGYIAFQGAEYVTAVSSWSATQIIVTVPSNVIPGNLYVNQNGTSSNLTAYTVVATPTISGTDEGFCYDPDGRPTDSFTLQPPGGSSYGHISESYYSNGAPQSISWGSGWPATPPTINYGLDPMGRPNSVTDSQSNTLVSGTSYYLDDGVNTVTFGNGDKSVYTEYANFAPNTATHTIGTSSNNTISYAAKWNANGTLSSLQTVDNFNPVNSQSCTFSYDDFVRLSTDYCGANWNEGFFYDPFGNITKSGSAPWPPLGVTYNQSNNQYTTASNNPFSYDANGRLLNDTFDTLAWDTNGNLVSQSGTTFSYDALDRPVSSTFAGVTTYYVYAPDGSMIATLTGSTPAFSQLFIGLPSSRAVYTGSALTLNHIDHYDWQGSARVSSTWSRALYGDVSYDAFGMNYWAAGASNNQYAGLTSDVSSGTEQVSETRRYHPSQGRWESPDDGIPDPYNPQTLNAYHYALNMPTTVIDPGGQDDSFTTGLCFGSGCGLSDNGYEELPYLYNLTLEDQSEIPDLDRVVALEESSASSISASLEQEFRNDAIEAAAGSYQVMSDTVIGGAKGVWNNYGAGTINAANNLTNALISPFTSYRFPLAGEYQGSTPGQNSAMAGVFLGSLLSGAGETKIALAGTDLLDAMRAQGRTITIAREGSEELRFLNRVGAEASVGGPGHLHILLRENPSKAAAMEEFLHGTQDRLGIIDRLGTEGAEIHVSSFMRRHAKLLGLE